MKEILSILRHPDGTYSSFEFQEASNSPPQKSLQYLTTDRLEEIILSSPLPFRIDSPPEIVGYVPHSFAIRLNPDKVAVIRPSPSEEHSDSNLRLSKLIDSSTQLQRSLIPEALIISNFPNVDTQSIVAIRKEVVGATFGELHPLAILGNRDAIRQFNQLLKESIEIGKRKVFPDFAGRCHQNWLRRIFTKLPIPICSHNFMIEYATNKVILVDNGARISRYPGGNIA